MIWKIPSRAILFCKMNLCYAHEEQRLVIAMPVSVADSWLLILLEDLGASDSVCYRAWCGEVSYFNMALFCFFPVLSRSSKEPFEEIYLLDTLII